MTTSILEAVRENKIITIVRGLGSEPMQKLAQALCDGGIRMMEVTFNQADPASWGDTLSAIRTISRAFSGKMHVGAGTVMTLEQLESACEAGAKFIISPNVNTEVIRRTKELGLASFPGALSPTEVAVAKEAGADFVKLFPAGILGAGYLKALRAPLSNVEFMAVGGVNEKNAAEFLRAGAVGLGIGGNLVNKAWIEAGEFDKITALARTYVEAVR